MDSTGEHHHLCFTDVDAIPAVCNQCPSSPSCLVQEEAKTSSFWLSSPLQIDSVGCLTSCKTTTTDDRVIAEQFLFGGFEMTTNTKSVEVYVCYDESGKDTYLTTSRGVPQRNLSPISGGKATTEGGLAECDRQGSSAETPPSEENELLFYKFVLVCPGGPKPLMTLTLKFSKQSAAKIVVRTLKIKGKLATAKPPCKKPSPNMSGMASMMAMMQQHSGPVSTSMQQGNREQDMRQAEILSSIVALSMTMRSSEERSMRRLEEMESRILSRLDEMAGRISTLEQYYVNRETSGTSGTDAAGQEDYETNEKSSNA
mmetsp:Transcript_34379/g.82198  ORF Transcript_34379/g.82198 Transcript_34379/m.82198 type:complete len:314 (-) Transcript_34379:59-1000(-)